MTAVALAKSLAATKVRAEEVRRYAFVIRSYRASAPRREGPSWVRLKIQEWYRQKLARSVARWMDEHAVADAPPSREYQATLLRDDSLTPMERLRKLREFNQRRGDE